MSNCPKLHEKGPKPHGKSPKLHEKSPKPYEKHPIASGRAFIFLSSVSS
jgi:hypothetical protein